MAKLRKVYKSIWLGPGIEVRDIVQSKNANSDMAILNVADDFTEYAHPKDILYIHAGLNDGAEDWSLPYGEDNPIMAYVNAINALMYLFEMKDDVFVHCHGGVSRSPFIVTCFIAIEKNIPYFKAKEFLHDLYERCNPHPKHEQKHILQGIAELTGMKVQ